MKKVYVTFHNENGKEYFVSRFFYIGFFAYKIIKLFNKSATFDWYPMDSYKKYEGWIL